LSTKHVSPVKTGLRGLKSSILQNSLSSKVPIAVHTDTFFRSFNYL